MYRLESNIWKLNTVWGLRCFLLMMPTIVLFFQQNGLTMVQILLLQSLFSVAIIVLEVPSGYFADRLGRRITILAGCVLGFIGFAVYSASHGFYTFLAAEMVLAVGAALTSGADSALIYDTLLDLEKEENYQKLEGRYSAIGNFSEATASIAGGFVALVSLRMTFYLYTAIALLAIPLAATLVEPPKRVKEDADRPRGLAAICRHAMHEHAQVKWLIVYASFLGASTLTMVWFIQPYLEAAGLPLYCFGIVWAGLNLSVGIFSMTAYRIERAAGRRASLTGLVLIVGLGYALVSSHVSIWGIAYIMLFYFARGVGQPVLKDYVNRLIVSKERATILSIQNMMARLVFAVTGPLAGSVADGYGTGVAFAACCVFFLASGFTSLFFLDRHKAL